MSNKVEEDVKEVVEVTFVLDTTGSMGGLIKNAKEKIWSIINMIVKLKPESGIRVGLIGFRDRTDEYITKITDLTDDIDALYYDLMAYKANGGGDFPESVCQALNESVKKISWLKPDDKKKKSQIIFLVGDAPPSMYKDAVHYKISCSIACELGIKINCLQCGDQKSTERYFREIAKLGKGKYIKIKSGGHVTVSVESPFDDEIIEVSKKLDGTRLFYGTHEEVRVNERRNEKASYLYKNQSRSANASRACYQASSWGYKKNFIANNELVNDWVEKKVDLGKIQKQIPKEMQKMNEKEQGLYLKKKNEEREEFRDNLKTLKMKRQKYIDEYKMKNKDKLSQTFEANVLNVLKKQIQ